jgi:phosphoglycolate phosphatase
MSKYHHVLFDFDGVLCDSLRQAMTAFNDIAAREFPVVPRVHSRDAMTVVYAGSLKYCLHPWLSEDDAKRFFDLHSAQMMELADELKVFEGVGALLSSLRPRGCSIVTSAYTEAVLRVLKQDPDFSGDALFAIAGRELRQSKTRKILDILASLGIQPADAIYVGDLESDILYCKDVPIDIIAVGYGYHPSSYLRSKNPTYLVESLADLHALLATVYLPLVSEVPA